MAYEYYTATLQLIGHKDYIAKLTDKSILLEIEKLKEEKRRIFELSKTWSFLHL